MESLATTATLGRDDTQRDTQDDDDQSKYIMDAFPNVEALLRIYLTFMISNCCGEICLFQLKLIKDEHRSTLSQNRLDHLTMLNMEWDITCRINLDKILSDF